MIVLNDLELRESPSNFSFVRKLVHRRVGNLGANEMKAPDYHVRGSNLGAVCDFLTRLKVELT